MPTCRWHLPSCDEGLSATVAAELGASKLLVQCLFHRGLRAAAEMDEFLHPRLRDLSDPFRLPGMSAALERLTAARQRDESITIFGDYDVDGITSTALLLEVLQALGWRAQAYLPNRFQEGYGLTAAAAENCLRKHPTTLLLAVDCGSNARETIDDLHAAGVDVLVVDHHQVSLPAPKACALINPHAPDAPGAEGRELASVGLAFKLAHALVKSGRLQGDPAALQYDLRPLLDLVALGTIADLVPLRRENRILVQAGLARLNATHRPGLRALISAAGIQRTIGVYEVGFQLAPRLNAAGRLEDASEALALIVEKDPAAAWPLATKLDNRNRERRQLEQEIFGEVLDGLRSAGRPGADYIIVEEQNLWHTGVIGIVASRVLREFHRPTLIVGADGRGSGRSIDGFDHAAALRECDDLLLRHGGHAMAAGLTLKPGAVQELRSRLNAVAQRILKPEHLERVLRLDAQIDLAPQTFEQLASLELLEPVGNGNPPPLLVLSRVTHRFPARRLGNEEQHARFWVAKDEFSREIIWWNFGERTAPAEAFDLVVTPRVNEYRGEKQIRLEAVDCRDCQG